MTDKERDYVLGTHDDEIERLGIQHEVWRARAIAAWQRAGITTGETVLDIGSGPGYATLDLASIVGPSGHVIAVDRSRRFLDALDSRRRDNGFDNIHVIESDLDEVRFEPNSVDAAWCRWVLAFVMRPRELLAKAAAAIRSGGVFVSHEYFDYASWRAMPPSPVFEEFVQATIRNWRKSGGEPDIGLQVPHWLEELGFTIESATPIVDVITPRDFAWRWPTSFMEVGLSRLIELGAIDRNRETEFRDALDSVANSPSRRMVTPALLEVVARKTT
ncbi:MAG TPA: methyltransferase domain-containing protein [Gemmatimonadaceae bacterium]|jgi:SAM-dependent methyltransferase